MMDKIMCGVPLRHTGDEPDPELASKLRLERVKPRKDEDSYKSFIDYAPGRDI